ncbi:hypothetical protein DACRYDRAFT_14359 [Dacryopinax primogenitus]|uniref:Uncharacterized protein n=1 Tax=Dacryopinax primogenitus (strain DJM 731) TaxID=1858805 RepID=M5G687_DACPD|nr:uncharacterized protein DACRYDRAFT_14359 [Dacryopinax primogenitus]EJU04199.1 hypothetical protein DACRYDRAFT_14359 [Dacryopinax primogenitus]
MASLSLPDLLQAIQRQPEALRVLQSIVSQPPSENTERSVLFNEHRLKTLSQWLMSTNRPPHSPDIASLTDRIGSLEQQLARQGRPSRRKRPRRSDDPDETDHPLNQHQVGHVNVAEKFCADMTAEEMSRLVRTELYAIIGFDSPHGTMPCKGEFTVDGKAVPDFNKKLTAKENYLIQLRAAEVVQQMQQSNPNLIPLHMQENWMSTETLIRLAQSTWQHMKWIWRAERRRTRTAQFKSGALCFAAELNLDADLLCQELIHEDWVGEECSAAEEGEDQEEWENDLLNGSGFTAEQVVANGILLWELRRPVWMHTAVTTNKRRASNIIRVDLGNTSALMPMEMPYRFMIDAEWQVVESEHYKGFHPRDAQPSCLTDTMRDELRNPDNAYIHTKFRTTM